MEFTFYVERAQYLDLSSLKEVKSFKYNGLT